ncbi:hypothetical protein BDV34DRAFT_226095 [Aspergillus parasiticus]|uniref:Uncharacterized protein n=1 Tax=Aspergillus parasiticus TaxID=5067 RepID=A0A5N6DL47_ASPPA|nr:hypothetical protein BDV34DRAFT_226095 [Aspergillus parasiticus]
MARWVVWCYLVQQDGAPSVPMVASIRPGYQLQMSGKTQTEQTAIQTIAKYLFQTLLDHPVCGEGMDEGLIDNPLAEDWEE